MIKPTVDVIAVLNATVGDNVLILLTVSIASDDAVELYYTGNLAEAEYKLEFKGNDTTGDIYEFSWVPTTTDPVSLM